MCQILNGLCQQIRHTLQADDKGGGIVQQRRGGGDQHAGYAQDHQPQVEADDEPVIAVNPLHQPVAQSF